MSVWSPSRQEVPLPRRMHLRKPGDVCPAPSPIEEGEAISSREIRFSARLALFF
jgi:hypothetical protein